MNDKFASTWTSSVPTARSSAVDHIQGSDIKLTKRLGASGQHHFIPLSWWPRSTSTSTCEVRARDQSAMEDRGLTRVPGRNCESPAVSPGFCNTAFDQVRAGTHCARCASAPDFAP